MRGRSSVMQSPIALEPAFALSTDALLSQLDSTRDGLSTEEAARRIVHAGFNELPPSKPVSALHILIGQLRSIVVMLLIVGALAAVWLGEPTEGAAIAVVLAINTAIGFYTEFRARRAMSALLKLDVPRATVLRSHRLHAIDARLLVPGDVIDLHVGQHVPADARVLHQTDLRVDEALLTGESWAVAKHGGTLPPPTPLAERVNMVYKGTTVTSGVAHAVVTATGTSTELGLIGALVGSVDSGRTPMERKLDALGHRLVWLALAVTGLVAVLGVMQGVAAGVVLQTAIALAVAAVPEGLPAVATIALAIGIRRMTRRHALVRRLPVVESLGSTTVICTDKTRTLTSGNMTVVRVAAGGEQFQPLDDTIGRPSPRVIEALEVAALASRPQADATSDIGPIVGDPVDHALMQVATRFGIEPSQLTPAGSYAGVVPFSSHRQCMASFHRYGQGLIAYAKGAPRRILELCASDIEGRTLDDRARQCLMEINDRYAQEGLRVLALARGPVESTHESDLRALTFIGFVGLMDPPAPGVRATIARLQQAGLRTIMLTGDQRLTAQAVARELGLLEENGPAITGRELDAMTPTDLEACASRVSVYSRISPEHKLAIVSALQARGEIVAMLGDGVNDAPALKKADVGVAMGVRGSDVAKEAAGIVLQDDRFETIAAAVEEGRIVFDNIRKFVFYLFSCNVAEVMVVLVVSLVASSAPLLPLQLLWLNIVTDTLPALALALEPGDADVMHRPPRHPHDAIMSGRFLRSIVFYGTLITISALLAFGAGLRTGIEEARTATFATLALAQIFHLGNARSTKAVVTWSRAAANPYAVGAVALSIALQVVAMFVGPLAAILRVAPLETGQWIVVILASAIPAIVGQTLKQWRGSA